MSAPQACRRMWERLPCRDCHPRRSQSRSRHGSSFDKPFRLSLKVPSNVEGLRATSLSSGRSHIQALLFFGALLSFSHLEANSAANEAEPKKIAVIASVYSHGSHADIIASRIFQTQTLDGKGEKPRLKLAALYVDQYPRNDVSRKLAAEYKFPIYENIGDTLTLGSGKLAVDGVLLIAEHGDYPVSGTGQTIYPKRRMFEQIVKVFEQSGRVVPVFIDKHVADNWTDAKWMYDTAQRMKIPLMAGSSLPGLWRRPEADVERGAKLKEIVAISYHTLDGYGFHALEMVQSLAERRQGGETGIKAVQCLTSNAVWEAGAKNVYDSELLNTALSRVERRPLLDGKKLSGLVPEPVLFVIDYADGLRANILTLNNAVGEWAVAWRYDPGGRVESTLFWTQEWRPMMHFAFLLQGIEKMFHTGKSTWPVERTLMTSGALDALLISKKEGGKRIETPHLQWTYSSDWNWKPPPPPPPNRPLDGP